MPKLRIFTDEEKQLIDQMYHEGYPYSDIYRALGCKDKPLRRFLRENGYPIRPQETLINCGGLKNSRKHHFNEDYFNVIDTEDKAYWLGFWFADGNVSYKKGKGGNTKGGVAEITLKSSDRDHLVKMLKCMDADDDYPIQDRTINLNGKEFTACRVLLSSIDTCRNLDKHGCVPAKSLILQPPIGVPDDLVRHFVRGYFDGDGCVSFNEETKVGCVDLVGTKDILNYIKEQSDLSDTIIAHDKRSNNAFQLQVGSISNIFIFYNYIYADSTIYLDRKKIKFDKCVEYLKINHYKLFENSMCDDSLVKHKLYGIPVALIDKDYNFVRSFESFRAASEYAQVTDVTISNYVNGKTNKKYINNYYYIKYENYHYNKGNLKEYMISNGYVGL